MGRGRERGFSLLEIVIGAGLVGVLIAAGFALLQFYNREMIDSGAKQRRKLDASVLRTHLKRYLAPGNMRHLAFSGKLPPLDQSLARLLLPLPGTCADLTSCPGTTAVIYPSYEKAESTGLNVICALNGREWLIDTLEQKYGTVAFSAGNFRISPFGSPSAEQLATGNGEIYGLLNIPLVTLWSSSAIASPVTVSDASGSWTYDFNLPLSADCERRLPADRSGLVKMPVRPVDLRQFTGGDAIYGEAELLEAMGSFPMRLVPVKLRSLGLIKSLGPKGEAGVVVRECTVPSEGDSVIRCDGTNVIQLTPATALSLDESFDGTLENIAATDFYEISSVGAPLTGRCQRENCAVLPVIDKTRIPVRTNGNEPPGRMDGRSFSLLKQESLRALRVRVRDIGMEEDTIDVPIH